MHDQEFDSLSAIVRTLGAGILTVPVAHITALAAQPGVVPAVMGTRRMRGWVHVDDAALDDEALRYWWRRAGGRRGASG